MRSVSGATHYAILGGISLILGCAAICARGVMAGEALSEAQNQRSQFANEFYHAVRSHPEAPSEEVKSFARKMIHIPQDSVNRAVREERDRTLKKNGVVSPQSSKAGKPAGGLPQASGGGTSPRSGSGLKLDGSKIPKKLDFQQKGESAPATMPAPESGEPDIHPK